MCSICIKTRAKCNTAQTEILPASQTHILGLSATQNNTSAAQQAKSKMRGAGPPEHKICFCAAARKNHEKHAQRPPEKRRRRQKCKFLKILKILNFHQKMTVSRCRFLSKGPAFTCPHGSHTQPQQSLMIFECICNCRTTNGCTVST